MLAAAGASGMTLTYVVEAGTEVGRADRRTGAAAVGAGGCARSNPEVDPALSAPTDGRGFRRRPGVVDQRQHGPGPEDDVRFGHDGNMNFLTRYGTRP